MDGQRRLCRAIPVLPGGRRLRPAVGGVAARVGLTRQNDQIPHRRMLIIIFAMFGHWHQPGLVRNVVDHFHTVDYQEELEHADPNLPFGEFLNRMDEKIAGIVKGNQ